MDTIYTDTAKILKAISDPKRLKIVDMLSCGELCACKILEEFHITQPTLSHDMKVLAEAKLVECRREGKSIYYSLNKAVIQDFQTVLSEIINPRENCIWQKYKQ